MNLVKYKDSFYRAKPFYAKPRGQTEDHYLCLFDFDSYQFMLVVLARQVEPATQADVLEDRMCANI